MSRHLIRNYAAPALALALIAGCHTQDIGQVGERPREAITFAARAKYPGPGQESPKVKAVALTDPDTKELSIYNVGDTAIPSTAIWVNGAFVRQIGPISPKSHVSVKWVELLEAGPSAKSLSELERTVQKVELQTSDGMFAVQGPVVR
jgi:hypothetical protein